MVFLHRTVLSVSHLNQFDHQIMASDGCADPDVPALGNTFLAQLRSIDTKSKELPEILAKMLLSKESLNTAMSLRDDDTLTLVDILDHVSRPRIIAVSCLIPHTGFRGPRYGV